jgi:hypothetical protein
MTYVALYGLDEARKVLFKTVEKAKVALAGLEGGRVAPLVALADFVASRER